MKKISAITLVLCLVFAVGMYAHDSDKERKEVKAHGFITDPMCAKSGDKAKMGNAACVKSCAKDGHYVFVNMEDGKIWMIENNDSVKGHEGHHVSITGHLNDDKGSVHIMTVAMMDESAAPKKMEKMEKAKEKEKEKSK
ncbi:MAG: hypothetical protein HYX26_07985 [Acidobacteriales bacterium]|nr:hypothetical protein [Terriglobales bacterium]